MYIHTFFLVFRGSKNSEKINLSNDFSSYGLYEGNYKYKGQKIPNICALGFQ